jgi:hypothetical protein
VQAYENLDVEKGDKTEAAVDLALDLSILAGMSTADLVMGALSHCLLILGQP